MFLAGGAAVLQEALTTQRLLLERCEGEYETLLVSAVLPALGCPADQAQEYLRHVRGAVKEPR